MFVFPQHEWFNSDVFLIFLISFSGSIFLDHLVINVLEMVALQVHLDLEREHNHHLLKMNTAYVTWLLVICLEPLLQPKPGLELRLRRPWIRYTMFLIGTFTRKFLLWYVLGCICSSVYGIPFSLIYFDCAAS